MAVGLCSSGGAHVWVVTESSVEFCARTGAVVVDDKAVLYARELHVYGQLRYGM